MSPVVSTEDGTSETEPLADDRAWPYPHNARLAYYVKHITNLGRVIGCEPLHPNGAFGLGTPKSFSRSARYQHYLLDALLIALTAQDFRIVVRALMQAKESFTTLQEGREYSADGGGRLSFGPIDPGGIVADAITVARARVETWGSRNAGQ